MPIPSIKIVITGVDRFTKTLGDSLKRIDKIGTGMKNAGTKMTMGVTVPAVGAGFAIARIGTTFQASMNKVEALTQASGKPLKQLSDLAKDLGSKTAFSAAQAADAMAFLGMAGFDTNQILQATPGLLNLAATEGMELGRAADIASNIMGAFGMKASQMNEIADILAATSSASNVSVEQLSETMKDAGPVAKMAGASLRDAAVAAGILGNVGIQGGDAGTAMKNMFLRLAAPASDATKLLEKLNIATLDGNKNLRPYADILGDLAGKMANLGTGQKLKVMDTLFGKIPIAGISALTEDIGAVDSGFKKLATNLQNVDGRAKQMADTMLKGAPGAFERFRSSAEGAAIALAESGFLDLLAKIADKFARFFEKMSKANPKLLQFGLIAAGIVAALGPLLLIVGNVMLVFSALGAKVAAAGGIFALLSNPIGWAVASVAAFVAIVAFMVKNSENRFGKLLRLIFPLAAIGTYIITRWQRLLPFFKLVVYGIVALFKLLWKLLKPILDPIISFFAWFGEKVFAGLDFILTSLEKLASITLPDWLKEKIGLGNAEGFGTIEGVNDGKSVLSAPSLTARATQNTNRNVNQTNIKIEDKAGVKISTKTEKGIVNTQVERGLVPAF